LLDWVLFTDKTTGETDIEEVKMPEIDEAFALLRSNDKKYRLERNALFDGAKKLGELRGEILDAKGSKIGSFRGNSVFDKRGAAKWSVSGGYVYDHRGKNISSVAAIKKSFVDTSDLSLVALWLLLLES
jgi:hypothetical protein